MRYLLVGGNPSGISFTGLSIVARSNTEQGIITAWRIQYNRCGGLLTIVDCSTGKSCYPSADDKRLTYED